MLFLAQVNPNVPTDIQKWLHSLASVEEIAKVLDQVMLAFILIGAFILAAGYILDCIETSTPIRPTFRVVALFVAVAASPWFVTLGEDIVRGTVGFIASYAPNLSWLVVNTPSDYSTAMNFSKPYQILSQFVAGKFQQGWPGFDVSKWGDYVLHVLAVAWVGVMAAVTVLIMELALIAQKLVLIGNRAFMPVFVACLGLPAARGQARAFLLFTIGVICWPIGWAVVHIGTMAALVNLRAPAWNSSAWELFIAGVVLLCIAVWMVGVTVGAPWLITKMVRSGGHFALGAVASWASSVGRHVSNVVRSGSSVGGAAAGAVAGAAAGNPATGAAIGASVGSAAGSVATAPLSTATRAAANFNETPSTAPSSRSAAAADLAISGLKKIKRKPQATTP